MIFKILKEVYNDTKFRLSKPHEREIQGFKMWIDTKESDYVMRKTLRYYDSVKAHEPATTKIFKEIVKRGDTVLDIGANIGYFSLLARTLTGPTGIIYAFEPELKNYDYLVKNIKVNKFENEALNVAVGNVNGDIDLFKCPYDSGHHTIQQDKGITEYRKRSWLRFFTPHKIERLKVPIVRIDNKIIMPVDVVKIDVEGSEFEVLKGMKNLLDRNDNIKIIMEFFPLLLREMGTNLNDLYKYIKANNFKIFIIPDDYSAGSEMTEVGSFSELMNNCGESDGHVNLLLKRK
jgi:FkbM family methyltransferase